jgi:multidrug efflux pump subunit AcrB
MSFIIQRKVLIAMLFAGLSMLGIFSYRQLPVELLPNTQIPYLFVMVSTPMETDPKYMESQAIIPIEGAIGTLKGVEKIESTADQQQGFIQISYRQNANIKIAYLKLLEKVEEVKKKIPSDFYVQAMRFDMEQLNNMLMTLQVRGGGGVDRVREVVNKDILNRLQNVNGTANVAVFGGREKSVEIILREEICNLVLPRKPPGVINQTQGKVFAEELPMTIVCLVNRGRIHNISISDIKGADRKAERRGRYPLRI